MVYSKEVSIILLSSLMGSACSFGQSNLQMYRSTRLSVRKRKEELDSILTGKTDTRMLPCFYLIKFFFFKLIFHPFTIGIGLEPARKTKCPPTQANQTVQTSSPSPSKSKSIPINISVKTQLDYARNGHTVLKSLVPPELLSRIRTDVLRYTSQKILDAWRQKVEVASDSPKVAQSCRTIEECQQQLEHLGVQWEFLPFLQFFNTWRDVPSVEELCHSLGETASTLLDVSSVRLYQDAVFSKRSRDGPTPWHTDARMAPFDTPHMLTIWIPLQDIPRDGTALIFCSKSHSDFALPFWNDFDGPEFDRLEERYKGLSTHHMPLALGDATVHSGWTLHCANGNDSLEDRHALAISFVDADAQVRETALDFTPSSGGYGDNEDQWSYREWVHDVKPRTPFRHTLAPIVWPLEAA